MHFESKQEFVLEIQRDLNRQKEKQNKQFITLHICEELIVSWNRDVRCANDQLQYVEDNGDDGDNNNDMIMIWW